MVTNEIISVREILLEKVRVEMAKIAIRIRSLVIFVRQVENKRLGVTFAVRI